MAAPEKPELDEKKISDVGLKKVGPARADCLHVHVSRCLPAAGVQCPPAVAAVVIILLLLPFLSTAVVAKLTCRVVLCCVVLCCVVLRLLACRMPKSLWLERRSHRLSR